MHDVSYIRLVRELIEHVMTQAEPFAMRGSTPDSARVGIDLAAGVVASIRSSHRR